MATKNVVKKEHYSLGVCSLEFVPFGVTESESNKVVIEKTMEESDTKLTTTTTMFEVKIDQAIGNVHESIANIEGIFTCSIPYDLELASKLSADWTAGSAGFGLGNIGADATRFKMTIKPKGSSTASEWIVCPNVTVTNVVEVNFKKTGLSKINLTIKLSSDESTDSLVKGFIFYTGNFVKPTGS